MSVTSLPVRAVLFDLDGTLGVEAAVAAGMRACGVTTGEPAEALLSAGALAEIPDFSSLPNELRALFPFSI